MRISGRESGPRTERHAGLFSPGIAVETGGIGGVPARRGASPDTGVPCPVRE